MSRALLLFDIDGTLLTTDRAGVRAMRRVTSEIFDRPWVWEGVSMAGRLDPHIYSEAAKANGVSDPADHHDRFHDMYIGYLKEELDLNMSSVRPMAGIKEILEQLKCRRDERGDVVLGLLTGNYTAAAPVKIRSAGLEYELFSITAFGDEADSRADLVALAMKKYTDETGEGVEPQDVVVVGDTPLDVACAEAHGCVSFAVATGRYSVEQLENAGANYVVQDLGDPGRLYRLIDEIIKRPVN